MADDDLLSERLRSMAQGLGGPGDLRDRIADRRRARVRRARVVGGAAAVGLLTLGVVALTGALDHDPGRVATDGPAAIDTPTTTSSDEPRTTTTTTTPEPSTIPPPPTTVAEPLPPPPDVEPLALRGAPGDLIDVAVPGAPPGVVNIYAAGSAEDVLANLGVVRDSGTGPRLVTTIPWGSPLSRSPLPPGVHDLVLQGFDFMPAHVGTIEVTAPGALPTPAGPMSGALPVLRPGGIGDLDFGSDRATTIDYLTGLLATEPLGDPQWDDMLRFGDLTVFFGDPQGPLGTSREAWTLWIYAPENGARLATTEGIGVGSTVGDLLTAFPAGAMTPCQDGLEVTTWLASPTVDEEIGAAPYAGLGGELDRDAGQIGATVRILFAGESYPRC